MVGSYCGIAEPVDSGSAPVTDKSFCCSVISATSEKFEFTTGAGVGLAVRVVSSGPLGPPMPGGGSSTRRLSPRKNPPPSARVMSVLAMRGSREPSVSWIRLAGDIHDNHPLRRSTSIAAEIDYHLTKRSSPQSSARALGCDRSRRLLTVLGRAMGGRLGFAIGRRNGVYRVEYSSEMYRPGASMLSEECWDDRCDPQATALST